MFDGEIIFHSKGTLKGWCSCKCKAWYKLLSSSGLEKLCAQNILLRATKYICIKTIL